MSVYDRGLITAQNMRFKAKLVSVWRGSLETDTWQKCCMYLGRPMFQADTCDDDQVVTLWQRRCVSSGPLLSQLHRGTPHTAANVADQPFPSIFTLSATPHICQCQRSRPFLNRGLHTPQRSEPGTLYLVSCTWHLVSSCSISPSVWTLVYSSQTNVSFSFKGFSSSASPSFPPEFWGICLRQTLSPLSVPCIHLTSFSLHSNHYFFHSNHYCFPTKTQLDRFCPLAVPGDGVLWNSFWRSIDHKRWQNGGEVVKARARPSSHKFDAQLEVRWEHLRTFPFPTNCQEWHFLSSTQSVRDWEYSGGAISFELV